MIFIAIAFKEVDLLFSYRFYIIEIPTVIVWIFIAIVSISWKYLSIVSLLFYNYRFLPIDSHL